VAAAAYHCTQPEGLVLRALSVDGSWYTESACDEHKDFEVISTTLWVFARGENLTRMCGHAQACRSTAKICRAFHVQHIINTTVFSCTVYIDTFSCRYLGLSFSCFIVPAVSTSDCYRTSAPQQAHCTSRQRLSALHFQLRYMSADSRAMHGQGLQLTPSIAEI